MRIRSIVTFCLASLVLLGGAGCERRDGQIASSEADEPYYRQGQQLVKQGRNQEALSAYLKVIAKRGESAPESHLEAGLLYLQQIKDPLAAIYHFRKYLELQPNSPIYPKVRGLVDTAKLEFARTLPAQPMESQAERLDMLDQIERLRRENEQLKAELTALRGGVSTPTIRSRATLEGAPAAETARTDNGGIRPFIFPQTQSEPSAEAPSPVTLAPETQPPPPAAQETSPLARTRAVPTKPTLPSNAVRRHTVAKGDTLYNLAVRYYGDKSKWRDIYAANRDVMPDPNALRLGAELKIP
jgi:tetratricopeptide (TPR) repeat protein